jgi:endonuclease YncB( thermonuclease family)
LVTCKKIFSFFFILLLTFNCIAFTGKVISISDGDTITIIDDKNFSYKIRLAGIDAPEKNQPFGSASKANLSNLIYLKVVTVSDKKLDKYGRTVGKVMLSDVDVCLSQISAGLAWHYVKYAKEQSKNDREIYFLTELKAREKKVGLWSDRSPIAPWDFRKNKK